jgi:hypothetical protein
MKPETLLFILFSLWITGLNPSGSLAAQELGERVAAPTLPPPGEPESTLPPALAPNQSAPLPASAPPASPPVAVPIGPDMANPPVAAPVIPASVVPTAPTGATISEMQSQSRVIESLAPERVQVIRDDPESAWWEINPHVAFDRAQREQRPLMLLFTGIWNTQAMALSEEVFATKSFNNYVKENLVICYLNYPRNYSDAPDPLRKIKDRYKVRGYPNVLIFNPNGEVEKGIRGYRTGRPIDYFNQLVGACKPVLESISAQKAELVKRGYRDWSNYLGKAIFAKFVKHDRTKVIIEDASGQKWSVPINDLAPEDQKMVESFPPVDTLEDE